MLGPYLQDPRHLKLWCGHYHARPHLSSQISLVAIFTGPSYVVVPVHTSHYNHNRTTRLSWEPTTHFIEDWLLWLENCPRKIWRILTKVRACDSACVHVNLNLNKQTNKHTHTSVRTHTQDLISSWKIVILWSSEGEWNRLSARR